MMKRTRIRIDVHGSLEIVDPGFDSLDLLMEIDPNFRIIYSKLPGFVSPGFLKVREAGGKINTHELKDIPEEVLWDIHRDAMNNFHQGETHALESSDEISLLNLKIELCQRILSSCRLCGRRCGVDRTGGEAGICGLGTEAVVADHFVHIAEEPPINPSLLVSLYGCGLRCRYCQQWDLLESGAVSGDPMDEFLWDNLDTEGARSLSFIGGNPDESLYAILRFLRSGPADWKLPVVWNCHSYTTQETLSLLDGVVDVYVPDLKYGSESCGRELSGIPQYPDTAKKAIQAMTDQDVPIIVRILVLPGHVQCCHMPALDFLASRESHMLFVSVRDQYCPDWVITPEDDEMARRPTADEIETVYRKALELGLAVV